MATPENRTLRHMRDELAARLGFGNQGEPVGLQRDMLGSFLREAYEDVYWQFGYSQNRLMSEVTTVAGTTKYDWPDDVDFLRRLSLAVQYNNVWLPIQGPGIDWEHDTFVETQAHPLRYDTGPQLEVWPEPDAVYTIRIEHYARLNDYFLEPAARQNSQSYAVGEFVQPATGVIVWPTPLRKVPTVSHFVYECTTAGVSHASTEPTWPVVAGDTVVDGTVTWTARKATITYPARLVFHLALYKAKAHYRQPDAEACLGAFNVMLKQMQGGEHMGKRYIRPTGLSQEPTQEMIEPRRVEE